MVSFQCHACGDVVKKPKLDQHRGRCQSGFDCIDCHATFRIPGEYKGHTSCMTEAEKYEKTLYKGPKTTSAPQRNNYDPKGSAPINNGSHPNPYSQRGRGGLSRGGGRGRMPHQHVQNSWGRPRYEGTGANDTPLGTPKMSPVTRSPVPENPPVPAAAPAAAPAEPHASSPVPAAEKKIKDKSKKRKSAPVDEEAVSTLKRPQDPIMERPPKKVKVTPEAVDTPTERKDKKSKRSAEKKNKKSEAKIAKAEEVEGEPEHKSKRRKSVASDGMEQREAAKESHEKVKKEKHRHRQAVAERKDLDEVKVTDEKKKKRKSLSAAAQGEVTGGAPEEKHKKKKTTTAEPLGEKVKKRSKVEKIDGGG